MNLEKIIKEAIKDSGYPYESKLTPRREKLEFNLMFMKNKLDAVKIMAPSKTALPYLEELKDAVEATIGLVRGWE